MKNKIAKIKSDLGDSFLDFSFNVINNRYPCVVMNLSTGKYGIQYWNAKDIDLEIVKNNDGKTSSEFFMLAIDFYQHFY